MNKRSNLFLLFLFSFSLVIAGSTYAATIFGPLTPTINRWHFHCSYNSFSSNTTGKGELVITRTASTNTVRGGLVLYNGQIISLGKFLQGDTSKLTKKIHIRPKNRLIVLLRGNPGVSITLEINQPSTVRPPEATINIVPGNILQGESATLHWSTSNANKVTLAPDIGAVEQIGSMPISPLQTIEYTLTATGPGGSTTARTSVNVTPRPPSKPSVTITATPNIIAPDSSFTLSWRSEHATQCTIKPSIGSVATSGSRNITTSKNITYTISAINSIGITKAKVEIQVYPVKVSTITKVQAHYKTPENTIAALTSALLQQDLDWYYQTFTVETARQDKKMFQAAGIDPKENFKMASPTNESYIIDKINYKDGILLILETDTHDIDGTIIRSKSGFILEDGLWKMTYNFSQDTELYIKYNGVTYTNCIATYRFPPADFLEDSFRHGNDLSNINGTSVALDKRYDKDITTAVFNGIDNGLSREQLNDMPREQLSMGGWIKADTIDHNVRIIEIGQDRDDSTAIVLDPGNGVRYWIHVNGTRVERTTAMDYDFHDNQWHHIYLTYDGTLMKLYVDSLLKDSYPAAGPIDSAPTLNIGQRNAAVNNGTANTFKGRIDDIQIYNKALTTDEIKKKYENGTTQSL